MPDMQDYPVLNTPSEDYTRIIDHNYFNTRKSDIHFLSYEYPEDYNGTNQRYYPIPKKEYYDKYLEYAAQVKKLYPKMILHGRLGLYKYLNMDQVIKHSIEIADGRKQPDSGRRTAACRHHSERQTQ